MPPADLDARHAVWRFDVPVDDRSHDVPVPVGARLVHAGCQTPDVVAVWAEVDPRAPREARTFQVFATGQPITPGFRYVGTALALGGRLVWHLCERDG